MSVNRESCPKSYMLFPWEAMNSPIQLISVASVNTRQHKLYACGYTAPKARLIGICELSKKRDTALERANAPHTKTPQLLGKYLLEATRTASK